MQKRGSDLESVVLCSSCSTDNNVFPAPSGPDDHTTMFFESYSAAPHSSSLFDTPCPKWWAPKSLAVIVGMMCFFGSENTPSLLHTTIQVALFIGLVVITTNLPTGKALLAWAGRSSSRPPGPRVPSCARSSRPCPRSPCRSSYLLVSTQSAPPFWCST